MCKDGLLFSQKIWTVGIYVFKHSKNSSNDFNGNPIGKNFFVEEIYQYLTLREKKKISVISNALQLGVSTLL